MTLQLVLRVTHVWMAGRGSGVGLRELRGEGIRNSRRGREGEVILGWGGGGR